MLLPISIGQIELDAAAHRFTSVHTNRGVAKIWSRFAIPNAELHDVDLLPGRSDKMFAETSREPARLQFQLARDALRRKQRPLAHARGIVQLRVFLDQRHRKVCLYRNAGETERRIVRSAARCQIRRRRRIIFSIEVAAAATARSTYVTARDSLLSEGSVKRLRK